MMVRAPDIDHLFVTALEFIQVISDVGCEIGKLAIFPLHHPVFLVAEIGGTEPDRAILLV